MRWRAGSRPDSRAGGRRTAGSPHGHPPAAPPPARALQLRLRRVAEPADGGAAAASGPAAAQAGDAGPIVRAAALAYSLPPARPAAPSRGTSALWGRKLDLPRCSQMVYPDGGRAWCSPTSTSMILGYWLPDDGACEPRVRAAVAGV